MKRFALVCEACKRAKALDGQQFSQEEDDFVFAHYNCDGSEDAHMVERAGKKIPCMACSHSVSIIDVLDVPKEFFPASRKRR